MKNKDGRAIARQNELKVLRALHRFGWLRTRDIAKLVWQTWPRKPKKECPSFGPSLATVSGIRMAQRTLRRMKQNRLILQAQAPDGSIIYALSGRGSQWLEGHGINAVSGKDLIREYSSQYYRHRCISNELAISAILQGYRVSTEREISQGRWLGRVDGVHGKKPDVLIRGHKVAWWVEVERTRKNQTDYAKLLAWLNLVRASDGSNLLDCLRLHQVVFICTLTFERKLKSDLTSHGWNAGQIDRLLIFETCLYNFEDIRFA